MWCHDRDQKATEPTGYCCTALKSGARRESVEQGSGKGRFFRCGAAALAARVHDPARHRSGRGFVDVESAKQSGGTAFTTWAGLSKETDLVM
jgi:hypothetical protein